MNRTLIAIVTMLGLGFGHRAVCAPTKEAECDPCDKPTAWDDFNAVELKMTSSIQPGYAAWRVRFDTASRDIQVDAETFDGNKSRRGQILLVGGRVMATQGPITEAGYEVDALDAPILGRQLLTKILGRSLPEGPPNVHGARQLDFTDDKTGVQFATSSAQGFIAAPWHLTGDVKVVRSDVVEFDLKLTVDAKAAPTGEARPYSESFKGRLSKVASAKIDDRMSLEGWAVFNLGVQTREEAASTIVDYGAAPAARPHKTIADIRKEIDAENFPGELDPTKNFTGFWKTKCEDPFGLQIMPFGTDGKYSITFCGPGGCGTAGEDGSTSFIAKDPHYRVVSESEIGMRNNDGSWETYHRCTADTHPVLEYKQDCDE